MIYFRILHKNGEYRLQEKKKFLFFNFWSDFERGLPFDAVSQVMIFKSYQEVLNFITEIVSSRYQPWKAVEYVRYNPKTYAYTHSDKFINDRDEFIKDKEWEDYPLNEPVEELRNRILSKK